MSGWSTVASSDRALSSVTRGRSSYSTSTRPAARSAASFVSAATAATRSPTMRTRSVASAGQSRSQASLVAGGARGIIWWVDQVGHQRRGIRNPLVRQDLPAQRVLDLARAYRHTRRATQGQAHIRAAAICVQPQCGGDRYGGVIVLGARQGI